MRLIIILTSITLLGFFFFPQPANATLVYSRTPSGFDVSGPITISVSVNSFSDFNQCGYAQSPQYWDIEINSDLDSFTAGPVFASTTLSATMRFDLPVGEYIQVMVGVSETPDVFGAACSVTDLEIIGRGDAAVFNVVSGTMAPTQESGFWKNRPDFVETVLNDFRFRKLAVSSSTEDKILDTEQILGAYYSSPSKTSSGEKRTELNKARLKLVQEIITAQLNCSVVSCSAIGILEDIAAADEIFSYGDIAAVRQAVEQLAAYNSNNDEAVLPDPVNLTASAEPRLSQESADISFWDSF